jgi:two-component sensor histidine kinase
MDERAFDLWGVPLSDYVSFDDLSAHIHPADRDRVKAAFSATRAIIGPYEIDFRILVGEGFRLGARAMMLASSGASCTEFHRRDGGKQAEEGNELLAGEMSHRVKNLLAIASGLTAIASRSAKTTADMAKELTQRLTALGRAHDLVRPLPGQGGKAALLGSVDGPTRAL